MSNMNEHVKVKILVIGLDGATLDIIEPWAKEGKLPVIARMMENGAYGPFLNTLATVLTASKAWSCSAKTALIAEALGQTLKPPTSPAIG